MNMDTAEGKMFGNLKSLNSYTLNTGWIVKRNVHFRKIISRAHGVVKN
jgi:hypothetical protein